MHCSTGGQHRRSDTRSARSERGATAVEYGLLVAFVAAAVIAIVTLLGTTVQSLFQSVQWW